MIRPANRTRFISTFALLAMLAAGSAAAAEKVSVRGGVHQNANRVVFDFPHAPKYTVKQDGGEVTITFSRAADLDVTASAKKLTRLADFSSSVEGETTTVHFRVAPDAKLSNFISGSFVVVDVDGAVPPAQAAAKPPEAKPVVAAVPAPAQTAAAPPTATVPVVSAPSVAAGTVSTLGILDIPASVSDLPVATFERGGNAYIVFDRRVKIKPLANISSLVTIDGGSYTGFRLPITDDKTHFIAQRDNNQWQLELATTADDATPIPVRVEPNNTMGPRVLLAVHPSKPAQQILSFIDPVIGDTLYVLPLDQKARIDQTRDFVDFNVLPSHNGIALRPLNDKLLVRSTDAGIDISAPSGLHLSDASRGAQAAPKQAEAPAAVNEAADLPLISNVTDRLLFDLDNWRQKAGENFYDARERLEAEVADAPNDARNKDRLDLARLYFANGLGPETRGLLDLMANSAEGSYQDLSNEPNFKAMQSAAEMLSGNPDKAINDFSQPMFADYSDMRLWQAVALADAHRYAEAAPLFDQSRELLRVYPKPFFLQFSLMAAETYIALGNFPQATAIIDQLSARMPSALQLPQVLYLRGVLQSRTGTFDAARKLWDEAAASHDQLASVRARFALIDMNLLTKRIKPEEAAEQLERLRFGWRGDDLEMQMLMRLADIYQDQGQAEDAMATLDHVKALFPEPKRDADITAREQKIFGDFFLSDQQMKLSPLKVLSLYNRFKDYMPADPVQKQKISDHLVERMLAMDLLAQAGTILQSRIADEADPATKAKLGAQLAGIRLLDHAPEQALRALDSSEGGAADNTVEERKLLRARALAEEGQPDAALKLLEGDNSDAALRLKATAAWQAKEWPVSAAALAQLLPSVPDGGKLTAEQGQIVINRAVALNLAGDQPGITTLAKTFGEAMQNTAQADTFKVLTNPDNTANSLAGLGAQAKGVDLFASFLENYRK